MIDRMEDAGMVERRPDPNDRRAWRLYLTDKSRPLIGQLRELGDQLMEQALPGVAADDRQRLGDILNTIRTNPSALADHQAQHHGLRGPCDAAYQGTNSRRPGPPERAGA